MDWINEKRIDGKLYTAYRDETRQQFIECDGEYKPCRLRDVWPFNDKITELFNGSSTL